MPVVTAVSQFSKGVLPVANGDCASDVVSQDYFIDLTTGQQVLNNIFDLGVLPAYHTIADAILICDDLDSDGSPAITLDVGLLTGTVGDATNSRTCGAEIFSASTAAQTGAVARPTLKTAFNILPTGADRSIGLKIAAAPATAVAGRVRLRVLMHQSDSTVQF